ncbi:MAG: hypothetical protein ACPG7U_03380 [Holosporaceae bacterium]
MTIPGEPDWMPAGAPVMIGPEGAQEIGIVVLPHAKVREAAKAIAQNAGVAPINPHITLIQGVFSEEQIEALKDYVSKAPISLPAASLMMDAKLVLHPSQNVFWDVKMTDSTVAKAGGAWLTALNYLFSSYTRKDGPVPAAPLWQVWDEVEKTNATSAVDAEDMRLIETYGRDFSLPGRNRPHITVGYGPLSAAEREALLGAAISDTLQEPLSPEALAICQIDARGNVVDVIQSYPLG